MEPKDFKSEKQSNGSVQQVLPVPENHAKRWAYTEERVMAQRQRRVDREKRDEGSEIYICAPSLDSFVSLAM